MKRREFIALLGGAAAPAFVPHIARAQQRPSKIPRIGIIDDGPIWEPFRQAFRDAGYVEGKTIAFEYNERKLNTDLRRNFRTTNNLSIIFPTNCARK